MQVLHLIPLAAAPDAFGAAFGLAAAILLIGGSILLRWQQGRQRFALMQAALDRGITQFPGTPPFWLVSLRQGLMTLTLGIGLVLVGSGSWWAGRDVPMPTAPADTRTMRPPPDEPPFPMPPDDQGPPGPPGQRGRGMGPQGGQPEPPPPRPSPIVQRWERAQLEQTLGLAAVGCGIILTLLGIARSAFATVERKYAAASTGSAST